MECLTMKQPSTAGSLPRGLDRLGGGGGRGGGFGGLGGGIPSTVPVANYFSSVRQGLSCGRNWGQMCYEVQSFSVTMYLNCDTVKKIFTISECAISNFFTGWNCLFDNLADKNCHDWWFITMFMTTLSVKDSIGEFSTMAEVAEHKGIIDF